MIIKKVSDKVALNVSAQGCKNDCTYWKGSTAKAGSTGFFWCKKVTDARWCKWW